jgi:uncharacterized BrkB/YihY/UPF0761 family membrane protein
MRAVFVFMMIAGGTALSLAFVLAVGYGIYEWANGLEFPKALWEAFKLWLITISVSAPISIIGLAGLYYVDKKNDL